MPNKGIFPGQTSFKGIGSQVDIYTIPGVIAWRKPKDAIFIEVRLCGGGGGGGSGRKHGAGAAGGASGGASAIMLEAFFVAVEIPDIVQVIVGAGGEGGAAISVDNTNGNPGSAGGYSSFHNIKARGGPGGLAGIATDTGTISIPNMGLYSGTHNWAFQQPPQGFGSTESTNNVAATGRGPAAGAPGGSGGAGTAASGGYSGWITGATNNMRSAILAQAPQYQTQAAIETHGQSKNGMLFHYLFCSPGGNGGGGSNSTTNSGNGGNGIFGSGGGGGGGHRNATGDSGAGGKGGDGYVIITTYF